MTDLSGWMVITKYAYFCIFPLELVNNQSFPLLLFAHQSNHSHNFCSGVRSIDTSSSEMCSVSSFGASAQDHYCIF